MGGPENRFVTMDREDVNWFLTDTNKMKSLFVPDAVPDLVDSAYAIPSSDWIKYEFVPAFKKFLFDNDLVYSEEDNDCEDFVDYGVTVGRLLYYHSPYKLKNYAISIGHLDVMENLQSHRYLMFLSHDAELRVHVELYEAQTQRPVEINRTNVIIWGWQM